MLDAPSELSYDHLVLALGASSSTFGLPGVEGRVLPLKSIEDGIGLRNQLVRAFELAEVSTDEDERRQLLTFVVVGGGFTGVEAIGEIRDFTASIARFYPRAKNDTIRLVLVEATDRLLPELPPAFGLRAKHEWEGCAVEVRTNAIVASADERGLVLRSGERLDARVIVWSAGLHVQEPVASLPVQHARNGAVHVRADLSLADFPGVWAIGDCAQIPRPQGGWYAPTAQNAIQEGRHVARNILACIRGTTTSDFHYAPRGMMASLGCRQGLAQFRGGRMITGFGAWLLWRSYYLMQVPGIDRKVRVALDWLLELAFARDIARLRIWSEPASMHPPERQELQCSGRS